VALYTSAISNNKGRKLEDSKIQPITITVLMAGTAQSERGVDETDKKK